ncbi:MAG: carbon-nitrogen family hydrolase [Opitutaceae bacterium]|nr:carbon-nitrogen family hydrolase [Opitutaceae bacterium]
MRVTAFQLEIRDRPKSETRQHLQRLLERARGSDLILLPEIWPIGYFAFSRYRSEAEHSVGPTVRFLQSQARALRANLFAGSFVERRRDRLYNTSLLIDASGSIRARYRKIHLFGYRSEERRILTAGRRLSVTSQPWGRTGLATCYDLRFPEFFRRMVDRGAEFFLVASAWPKARLDAWRLFNRSRAHENLAFVLACNCAGTDQGQRYAGHSMFVDPRGEVLAEAGDGEELLTADIDPRAVRSFRREFSALADRVFR